MQCDSILIVKTINVRNLPNPVHARFTELAAENHRNAEAQLRWMIEQAVAAAPADTSGELAERIWTDPAPEIDEKALETLMSSRGRRSPRPA
jgi:plasmid stability protein